LSANKQMIAIDTKILKVRDRSIHKSIQSMLAKIESQVCGDSFIGYVLSSEVLTELSKTVLKNNNSYEISYRSNFDKLFKIKSCLSWEFIEPFTALESEVQDLIKKAECYLEEEDYTVNERSKDTISEANRIFFEYIVKYKLVDHELRTEFFKKLNKVRSFMSRDDLISQFLCNTSIEELEMLSSKNEPIFDNLYSGNKIRSENIRSEFNKMRNFFDYETAKAINIKLDSVTNMLSSQSYENFREAEIILSEIEKHLSESAELKKRKIFEILRSELESLKICIWLDDWDKIKKEIDLMISTAEKTGDIKDLNLDKFKTDILTQQKKNDIYNFISETESANIRDESMIANEARKLLRIECSRSDLKELEKHVKFCREGNKNRSTSIMNKKRIYYSFLSVLILALVTLLIINHKKNTEHYEAKGAKYAGIVETMVHSTLRSGKSPDIKAIRKRITAPKDEFEIIAVSDTEVSVRYRGKVYKKSVRPLKK